MGDLPPTITREEALLAEAASLSAELMRDAQARALAAEDGQDFLRYTQAFHIAGRSLRQSVALKVRLHHAIRSGERQERLEVARDHALRLPKRAEEVRLAGRQMIWNECEKPDDREPLYEALHDFISDAGMDEDFTQLPLSRILATVRERLGFADEEPESAQEELLEPRPARRDGVARRAANEMVPVGKRQRLPDDPELPTLRRRSG